MRTGGQGAAGNLFAVAFVIDASHTPRQTSVFSPASVSEQGVLVVEEVVGQRRITGGAAVVLDQRRAIVGDGWVCADRWLVEGPRLAGAVPRAALLVIETRERRG